MNPGKGYIILVYLVAQNLDQFCGRSGLGNFYSYLCSVNTPMFTEDSL